MNAEITQLVCIENGEAVTTTLAIAEGTEVEHASIIKLVRNYLSDLEEFGRVRFQIAPFKTAGGVQRREVARLNEQHATLIMTYMKNSEIVREFKKRLVKAFYQMAINKHTDAYAVLNDPAAMRGLLLNYAEKVEQRDKLIADMQPKVEAFHQLERADGNMNLTTAAKVLNVPPQKFNRDLEARQWIYRMGVTGAWTGRQEKINAGYLVHKIFRQEQADGTEKARAQVLITPKGMAKLALAYNTQLQEAA